VIRRCAAFVNALYVRSYKAGKLEAKPFMPFFSLLAFQPPSLQPIVVLADGLMLVFQNPFSGADPINLLTKAPVINIK
jgi:hypothetical protein